MDAEILRGLVSYFGAGGALLVFVLVVAKGLLSWKGERAAQTPSELHSKQLETFQRIAEEANRRADAFAAERNDLVVKVTRHEGELARLNEVVDQNVRLRAVVDEKDQAIRKMITDHTETVHRMLDMIEAKDTVLVSQTAKIAALEEAMRNVQAQVCRHSQE